MKDNNSEQGPRGPLCFPGYEGTFPNAQLNPGQFISLNIIGSCLKVCPLNQAGAVDTKD